MFRPAIHALLALSIFPMLAFSQPVADVSARSTAPAERLSEGWWKQRWEAKLAATKEGRKSELVFLGDSITQGWEEAGKEVWKEHFEKFNPLDLGFSGDRTEHLIWRIQNGELTEVRPKIAVIMIGTNNTGHEQRPAAETAAGIKAAVTELRKAWPKTKFLLLAIFPRGEGTADPFRKINNEINTRIAKLANGKSVQFLDISASFLAPDGTLPPDIMPDKLHLSAAGYEAWAKALQPKLKAMGL